MILSNKELGKYLRDIREQLGYSIYDVNKLCDISPSYLSLMENGKRKPSAIILKKIAPIYSLNYLDLYEKAGYIDLINDEKYISTGTTPDNIYDQLKNIGTMYISNAEMVKIPVLGVVKAGYDYLAQENWIGTIDVEKNIVNDGSEYFALKVVGDSMSPVLIQDDIVVIKKQNDFENGDIVVAIVNGNEATIKKGKKTDSSITLQPLNTAYDPLVFTYDEVKSIPVTIVGIVKQLKRDF